jgi:glycosyltransferase involved in cell wall biosynthesis
MKPGEPKTELRNGRKHLVAWLGIMGPQDGVDGVLDIAHKIVREHGREDVQFALLGFGDCLEDLKQQCHELGLDDYVTFTGRVGPPQIADYLSTASLGLSADPLSPLNDVSTMNKTMEYMAYALPVVAYRLTETVVSAGECAEYLEPGDADGFAKAVIELLDDPERRQRLGGAGRARAEQVLDWRPQANAYVSVYDSLFGFEPVAQAPRPAVVRDHRTTGRRTERTLRRVTPTAD